MIVFFGNPTQKVYAVETQTVFSSETVEKLHWLFAKMPLIEQDTLEGEFVGPRASMTTPWSTNAVEITQNMGISGIIRIEEYTPYIKGQKVDPMLYQKYLGLSQSIFTIEVEKQEVLYIEDIGKYNLEEGLALSQEEVVYLEEVSQRVGRKLTDSEVFGFSQVNSEHCRHKIFNGTFVIDGQAKEETLFGLIKKTSKQNPNGIVSAYKDNVAFVKGPKAIQFAPASVDKPSFYEEKPFDSVLSLKAETHNFPTTVEPFNGAATGSGGEIRDRLAGGKGSLPLAGTAVYMTSYTRLEEDRMWESHTQQRPWLYQNPTDILIKASNGASDFGNKFGQPLITGSVLTFENQKGNDITAFDKVIMQAGGIGYGKENQALKAKPQKGDDVVILGGDNYRIGMGGAAVSSADTGAFSSGIELNAVQRSNPEMQKRAANTIRAMVEADQNYITSIHDHGAGGHLNCLSELVEETGGNIDLDQLPVGDPTLSAKEIIGNESQERIGLVIPSDAADTLERIAQRERSPMYKVGKITTDHRFKFSSLTTGETPLDLALSDMFGSSPKTVLEDTTVAPNLDALVYKKDQLQVYLEQVLQLEAVACKDWLTNKVDRCVGGKVAKQQTVGSLQLPLNNCGVSALDFSSNQGIATAIGHAPVVSLIDPVAGSKNAIAESLTNIVFAPLEKGLEAVSLSANWMWPCKNEGQDARLYKAVEAVSDFAIDLGINIPTGKDSLSMKQKYKDRDVLSPGTVIISAAAQCSDINKVIEPCIKVDQGDLYYLNFSKDTFKLGGSSFAQLLGNLGNECPTILDNTYFKKAFNVVQKAIANDQIIAGHDVGSGGLITTLLELCFANTNTGATLDLTALQEKDIVKTLFNENIAVVLQANKGIDLQEVFASQGVDLTKIGTAVAQEALSIEHYGQSFEFSIPDLRKVWFKTSYLLDNKQTSNNLAKERYDQLGKLPLVFNFPSNFDGVKPTFSKENRPKAAIIREKGSNSEREMANAMYLAGFDVKDVHMTDLISGREDLQDVQFIGAVGGFSNSDVLGSAKGWAGAFKYNEKARKALENFFKRPDTLSVGICNGCQLFMELDLMYPNDDNHPKMGHNDSRKHECSFTAVTIQPNNSVMLSSLEGTTLGVWISHGEGKFNLPKEALAYHIVGTYQHDVYPINPNGSDYNTAMLCDATGRHLATMPHIERSIFPWNWANYQDGQKHQVTPWLEAFVNARNWILDREVVN